jgi:hypothetical protein
MHIVHAHRTRCRIQEDDRIILLQPEWLKLVLNGIKDLEIRDKAGKSVVNKRIWLCESRTSTVFGYAHVDNVLGPLCEEEWAALRPRHRVEGGGRYRTNYAWVLTGVTRLKCPVRIKRKWGSVGIQVGPGRVG